MKKYFLFILLFCTVQFTFAQVKKASLIKDPVLHSTPIGEESILHYRLSSNYYPLKGNIENPSSSVYISDSPTTQEAFKSATSLFPHFFIFSNRSGVSSMIMLNQRKKNGKSTFYFIVMDIATQKWKEYPCPAEGEISEYRAKELVNQNYAKKAELRQEKNKLTLYYDGKKYSVQPYLEMKKELTKLIETKLLNN